MPHSVIRYHDICAGHRVVGHEGKCRNMHGHNYRVYFHCQHEDERLDNVGRVIDFSVVKEKLCMWLEEEWDHRFLAWEQDDIMNCILTFCMDKGFGFFPGLVRVPFNPTAENMAEYLVQVVGPAQLEGTGVYLSKVIIEETAKCHVEYRRKGYVE